VLLRFALLLLVLLLAVGLNICVGDVTLNPQDAFAALCHGAASQGGMSEIIWQIRLPRLLTAMIVGTALSVSGYLLQTLSRNQLADPYLTGVSSGAGVAVALAMMLHFDFSFVPLAAFTGGLISSLIVAFLARGPAGLSITRLLLSGVGLSAICSGLIMMLMTNFANLAQSQGIFFWLAGGIAGRTWSELIPACITTSIGLAAALLMSKQLRLLSLGAQSAQSLGLDVARTQWLLLSSAVLLCGGAVCVSGLVGFVGLIAPHLARRLFGRDERVHLACASLIGMALVLVSDLAARTLGSGQELPLGTLLSLIGGPFFLFLVSRQRGEGL